MNLLGKPLSENQVLKKLNITSFGQLKKDDLIKMESMFDKMDPEVAKKAIEQFPEFASTMKEMISEYKLILDESVQHNDKSVDAFYISCDAIISSLQNLLEKEELTFEEKKYIIEKMVEVNKIKGDKDSENKKFLFAIASLGTVAVAAVSGGLASILGTKISVSTNDSKKDIR